METRISQSRIAIEPRPIRQFAAENLRDLRAGRALLIDAGIAMQSGNRIEQAIFVLEAATETGQLLPIQRGDEHGLYALEVALDYSAIARSLGGSLPVSDRRELRDSLAGELAPPSNRRSALQLQSQFVAMAAAKLGELHVSRPSMHGGGAGKSPDMIAEIGTMRYGIECKRPQRIENVLPRFQEGIVQLSEFDVNGGVLIDVSDCVRDHSPASIDDTVERVSQSLYNLIFTDGVGHKPGMERIMTAGCFARVAVPVPDGANVGYVQLHTSSLFGVFARAKGTLTHHHARELRTGFQDGFDRLYRTWTEEARSEP